MPETDNLLSIQQLSDEDLHTLLELFFGYLDAETPVESQRGEFWSDLVQVLDAERLRRRREVMELERLYFMS